MSAVPILTSPQQLSTERRRVYAVGDIHGRIDCLCELLEAILRDARESSSRAPPILVFLGDYVDRGPSSKEVIETLITLEASPVLETVALKGNHEAALLKFLDDPGFGPEWAAWGGAATLASYGVTPPRLRTRPEAWAETCEAFQQSLPASHRRFLERLALSRVVGDYLFVHAGVRPGVEIEAQLEADLLNIRRPFLESDAWHGKVVVHGHTPTENPADMLCRIGVDTGAYVTGVLTAVRLEGGERRFLHSSGRGRRSAGLAERQEGDWL